MKKITMELPAMFADHHVTEVRRLLNEIDGVSEIYASSSYKLVDISFDESKTNEEKIKETLDKAGYLGEIPMEVEQSGDKNITNGDAPFFRKSSSFSQTKSTVSFTQKVPYVGRPLWPCPGMGPITEKTE